jgi:hypothetical protein
VRDVTNTPTRGENFDVKHAFFGQTGVTKTVATGDLSPANSAKNG